MIDHSDLPGWPAEPTRVYVDAGRAPFDHSWDSVDRELCFATKAGLRLADRVAEEERRKRKRRAARKAVAA